MARRKRELLAIGHRHPDKPLSHPEGGLERVGQAGGDPLADRQAVDHHLDGVPFVLVEIGRGGGVDHLGVDPRADEPLPDHLRKELLVLALSTLDERSEQEKSSALFETHELIDHLFHGLRSDGDLAIRTERDPDGGPEKSEIVVNLGHRADGRPGVARCGFLLDGDGRRQPFDGVDIGFFHLIQKLPRIGRQRLDIPPLALGEKGVERQRRLARAGNPGDHHQPVPRDGHVDVREVVLTGAADDDVVPHHQAALCRWTAVMWILIEPDTRENTRPAPFVPDPVPERPRRR